MLVKAKTRGQTPDGEWHVPGDPPFEVEDQLVSHIWMERADGKAWPKEKVPAIGKGVSERIEALEGELEAERAKVAEAEKRRKEAQDDADAATQRADKAEASLLANEKSADTKKAETEAKAAAKAKPQAD